MVKAIVWKEWRRSWKLFAVFALAAIVLPALPGQLFPNEGATAREFMRFIWALFSLFVGSLFGMQNRAGTIPFLLARPATRPFLFSAHYVGYLTMIAVLIVVSLTAHCVHMAFISPDFSALEVLYEPSLIFGLAACFLLFSFSLFIANSFVTFGATKVGVAVLALLILLAIALFAYPGRGSSSGDDIAVVRRAYRYLFDPVRMPIAYLSLLICGGVIFGALSLWEIAFDEMRDARNRRWIRAVACASILSVVLVIGTERAVDSASARPSATEFTRVLAGAQIGKSGRSILAVTDDAIYALYPEADKKDSMGRNVERIVKTGGRSFFPAPGMDSTRLVFLDDRPVWGQEIRLLRQPAYGPRTISPRYYAQRETLGAPFMSPDNDRIAYMRTSASRFRNKTSRSLWITKFGYRDYSLPISDHAVLTDDAGADPAAEWEPIGWTPDGYDFMLRKKSAGKSEIWAVDWVARGPRRFLEEFPEAIITEDDLPGKGEWISLLEPGEKGKQTLWLVNYKSGESKELGVFENQPVRAWEKSGWRFAYSEPGGGMTIWHFLEHRRQKRSACPRFPPVQQIKWLHYRYPPAAVIAEQGAPGAKSRLVLLEPSSCEIITLVDDFPATADQWDWMSANAIIFADGGDLWQVQTDGTRTLLFSLASITEE